MKLGRMGLLKAELEFFNQRRGAGCPRQTRATGILRVTKIFSECLWMLSTQSSVSFGFGGAFRLRRRPELVNFIKQRFSTGRVKFSDETIER